MHRLTNGVVVIISFALVALLILTISYKSVGPSGEQESEKGVVVNHEWGELKEVIIGTSEDIIVPEYCEELNVLQPEYAEFSKKYGGMHLADIDPECQQKVVEQVSGLVEVLEKRGITVHRGHKLKPEEDRFLDFVQKGRVLTYARDPIIVIENHVIEGSLRIPFRRKERYSMRPVLDEVLPGRDAHLVSVQPASPHIDETGPFLEGGDVLLNGYDIYVGETGKGSNTAGAEWLQDYLGPEYRVQVVPLRSDFIHLDCVLSLVRPGLALIQKDAFLEGIPDSIKDWDFIEITKEEAEKLGANVLVVDERTVIVDEQFPRIAEELRKRGVEAIEIPYGEVATFGGGLRCSHHPLVRESKLDE